MDILKIYIKFWASYILSMFLIPYSALSSIIKAYVWSMRYIGSILIREKSVSYNRTKQKGGFNMLTLLTLIMAVVMVVIMMVIITTFIAALPGLLVVALLIAIDIIVIRLLTRKKK